MNWKAFNKYKNKNGKEFSIEYAQLLVENGADYFPFGVKIINKELKDSEKPCEHIYKVFIKNSHARNWGDAENYLTGFPLEDIRLRLENIDNSYIPMYLPDFNFRDGYAII